MKNLFFALLFVVISTTTYAQNPRIEQFKDHRTETYSFKRGKGDSVQFTLKSTKDTIQTIFFYRNGKKSEIVWKDSSFNFDVFGKLRNKYFGFSPISKEYDSLVFYHANGQLMQKTCNKTEHTTRRYFDKNGQLTLVEDEKTPPQYHGDKLCMAMVL